MEPEHNNEKTHDDESVKLEKSQDIRISKKAFGFISAILVLLLVGLLIWQTGGYSFIRDKIQPSSLMVTVKDTETSALLANAKVSVNGTGLITGATGIATFQKLRSGNIDIAVTDTNYHDNTRHMSLKRGTNSVLVSLAPIVESITFSGKVTDSISKEYLADVSATLGDKTTKSGTDGTFFFERIKTGDVEISLEKVGFEKKTQKVNVQKNTVAETTLLPSGRVFFTSNRDSGKRGIYAANYDGSNIVQVVKRVDGTEDYNVTLTADGKQIAFLSTREKRPMENSGDFEPSLYIVNSDGTNLVQVSKDYGINTATWSKNGQYLAWQSSIKTGENPGLYIYDTVAKTAKKISTSGAVYNFQFNNGGGAVVWLQTLGTGDPSADLGIFYQKLPNGTVSKITDKDGGNPQFTNNDLGVRYDYYDNDAKKVVYMEQNINTGIKTPYLPISESESVKAASPDGKSVAFIARRDGKSDIYLSGTDGKDEKKLSSMGSASGVPSWDLSGRYIIFSSSTESETALYIVGTVGGTAQKITDIFAESYQNRLYSR